MHTLINIGVAGSSLFIIRDACDIAYFNLDKKL